MTDSSTSVDRVLDEFLERVRSGRYVPGQRLIAGDVARELSCSRAPVREALHVLAGEGVLEMTPNQGARIRELTPQDLVHGMLLLKAVGALGIEHAAPKMHLASNVKRIKAQAKTVFAAAERRQPYPWFTGLIELHKEINDISGNLYLNRQVFGRAHLVFFNRELAERLPGRHWDRYVRNYEIIIDALLAGEPRKTRSAFTGHMSWAIDLLRKEYLKE